MRGYLPALDHGVMDPAPAASFATGNPQLSLQCGRLAGDLVRRTSVNAIRS